MRVSESFARNGNDFTVSSVSTDSISKPAGSRSSSATSWYPPSRLRPSIDTITRSFWRSRARLAGLPVRVRNCRRTLRPSEAAGCGSIGTPQPAASEGLSVRRQFLTLTGEPANLARLRQNDRVIVSIDGRNLEGGYHEVAL